MKNFVKAFAYGAGFCAGYMGTLLLGCCGIYKATERYVAKNTAQPTPVKTYKMPWEEEEKEEEDE